MDKFVGLLILDMPASCKVDVLAASLHTLMKPFDYHFQADLAGVATDQVHLDKSTLLPGLLLMSSDAAPYAMDVPTRISSVYNWFAGNLINLPAINEFTGLDANDDPGYAPIKLMLRLNSEKHNASSAENYAQTVFERVYQRMSGKWTQTLLYLGIRPSIVLTRNSQDMYMSLLSIDGCSILLWTSECEYVLNLTANSDTHDIFCYNITPMYDKSVLVLHPVFLLSKVRKWGHKSQFNTLKVFGILERYLSRISL